MAVHSFHIFDRRGKTLFTKRYVRPASDAGVGGDDDMTNERLSEQRKLVFGMLFSLRELSNSLRPGGDDSPGDLQMVKTGSSTLYNFETVSGLRFVLYTTAEPSASTFAAGGVASPPASGGATPGPSGGGGGGMTTPSPSSNAVGMATPSSSGAGDNLVSPVASSHLSASSQLLQQPSSGNNATSPAVTAGIRIALRHVYEHIWVTFVVRSPMYQPTDPNVRSTNFEASLDAYLKEMPWFR